MSLGLIIAEFCAFTQTSRQAERHASEPNQEHTYKLYIVPYTKSVYPIFSPVTMVAGYKHTLPHLVFN